MNSNQVVSWACVNAIGSVRPRPKNVSFNLIYTICVPTTLRDLYFYDFDNLLSPVFSPRGRSSFLHVEVIGKSLLSSLNRLSSSSTVTSPVRGLKSPSRLSSSPSPNETHFLRDEGVLISPEEDLKGLESLHHTSVLFSRQHPRREGRTSEVCSVDDL